MNQSITVETIHYPIDLLEVRRDRSIDVLCLVETWHDTDAVCFRRLRSDGFQVTDRPRPRSTGESSSLSTNHGGVAVVAVLGVHLSSFDAVSNPTSFELLCTRITSGKSTCIVVVIYRPGSASVSSEFFDDLSDTLDCVVGYNEPIFIVGDLNVIVWMIEIHKS